MAAKKKHTAQPKGRTAKKSAQRKTAGTTGKPAPKPKAKAKNSGTGNVPAQRRARKTATPPSCKGDNSAHARAFAYDVCFSFAGEDRAYVNRVATYLKSKGVRVFYDQFEQTTLWGKDLYAHLDDIYRNQARFCVMFISEAYGRKLWTKHERQSAQARAFRSPKEYILPARFENTPIPGIRETAGYIDLTQYTPTAFAKLIIDKMSQADDGTSPFSTGAGTLAKAAHKKQTQTSTPSVNTKVSSSGAWVLLGETFFQSLTVTDGPDGTIEATLAVRSPGQEAALRAIKATPYHRHPIAYAHANDAALVEVQSVVMGSIGGKQTCSVTLRPSRREHSMMEVTVNGVTPDQGAEKRARLILLGEPLTTGDRHADDFLLSMLDRGPGDQGKLEAVLPKLWHTHRAKPAEFLRLARLQSVFALKMTHAVEHILALTLGPITKPGVRVHFEGRRRQVYTNRPAMILRITGTCALPVKGSWNPARRDCPRPS
jgi:hypothetical protein